MEGVIVGSGVGVVVGLSVGLDIITVGVSVSAKIGASAMGIREPGIGSSPDEDTCDPKGSQKIAPRNNIIATAPIIAMIFLVFCDLVAITGVWRAFIFCVGETAGEIFGRGS